jgi:hypothetical protein
MLITRPQLRAFRVCPHCGHRISPDPATKRRQLIAIFLAIVSLYATIQIFFHGNDWRPLACASYIVFGIFIYYANAKVVLVEIENGTDRERMIKRENRTREQDRHKSQDDRGR